MRRALYPCCATDFDEPYSILTPFVDEVLFCDPATHVRQAFDARDKSALPKARLLSEKVDDVLDKIAPVEVLFYRRDSGGEGGSGLFVLGDGFMRRFLPRFANKGLIITDGSAERGGWFRKMTRSRGLQKYGFFFEREAEQPYLDRGLTVIQVRRLADGIGTAVMDRTAQP